MAAGTGLHGPWQTYVVLSAQLTELRKYERGRGAVSAWDPDDDPRLQTAVDNRIHSVLDEWLEQQRSSTPLWRRKVEIGTLLFWIAMAVLFVLTDGFTTV